MAEPLFGEMSLTAEKEHRRLREHVREELRQFDHPEALRAMSGIVALLRMLAGSLWDGGQGLHPMRQMQARIDATVMADLGTAMDEHIRAHRH